MDDSEVLKKILDVLKDVQNMIDDDNEDSETKRSCSIRSINKKRNSEGHYVTTFLKMKCQDEGQFFIYTRMKKNMFDCLLGNLAPYLRKRSHREPVSPECRLAVTLLYLSQGCSVQSIAWMYQLGKETVRLIIIDTCQAIFWKLGPIYVAKPNDVDMRQIAEDFRNLWNMPNCIGAIDGKHIAITCPRNSGSNYYNYMKFYSIVLLAVADARYSFTYVDIGAYGSQSDGGIFQVCGLGRSIAQNRLNIPGPKNLPGTNTTVPHFFVGDAAFPLTENLMRPFSGRNLPPEQEMFNKRLSRARRVVENAFGILAARWRILLTTINMHPKNVDVVVGACVTLHNYLILSKEGKSAYVPEAFVDWEDANVFHAGSWREETENSLHSMQPSRNAHNNACHAKDVRENLKCFLNDQLFP